MYIIDIDKCYQCKKCADVAPGLFTLIEEGIREIVCRKCRKPNCVEACPEDALETVDGKLKRYTMKCVSCKQCSYACPVGANPSMVLNYRTFPSHINIEKVIKICRKNAVSKEEKIPEDAVKINEIYAVRAAEWK
ncbi:MAG: 4Fe-4S binding protein [Elusimicrobia bacterium]|jgi:Fe-S-cluster-containing hydrogenase component 2|nr:4Fe-4S binding protein [Elusimicrobiota bacterium]